MSPIFTIALRLGRFEAIDARGTVKRITARGEIKHFVMAITPKFAEGEGFRFLQTFTETDSGADDDRPELTAAIERARKANTKSLKSCRQASPRGSMMPSAKPLC